MVDPMDKDDDVERLFSWLKTPELRYREFGAEREIADAVGTWPALHKTAVQTGHPAETVPPERDTAARERLARETMTSAPTAARMGGGDVAPAAPPPAPASVPSGERLVSALGRRVQAARSEQESASRRVAEQTQTAAPIEREMIERRDEPYPAPRSPAGRDYPAPERGALFAGGQRDDESRPAGRQDRSLDAVFSRLSGGRTRLPDPRGRSRTTPGLGAVFNRLR
jgi:hypothetical protein